ncbi:hypothetical protein PMAYCL1PPCAC_01083, partial [Pristionchus mayeri]
ASAIERDAESVIPLPSQPMNNCSESRLCNYSCGNLSTRNLTICILICIIVSSASKFGYALYDILNPEHTMLITVDVFDCLRSLLLFGSSFAALVQIPRRKTAALSFLIIVMLIDIVIAFIMSVIMICCLIVFLVRSLVRYYTHA